MTCLTCGGTKLCEDEVPVDLVVLRSCRTCVPVPFAEINTFRSPRGADLVGLFVGDHLIDWDESANREQLEGWMPTLREQFERITAAVTAHDNMLQQRLHRLRMAASDMGDAARRVMELGGPNALRKAQAAYNELVQVLTTERDEAPPDFVPADMAATFAFELGREKFRTESQLRGLIDHLLENAGDSSDLALAMAEAADLRIPAIGALRNVVGAVVNELAAGGTLTRSSHFYEQLKHVHLETRPFKKSGPDVFQHIEQLSQVDSAALTRECRRRGLPYLASDGDGRFVSARVDVPGQMNLPPFERRTALEALQAMDNNYVRNEMRRPLRPMLMNRHDWERLNVDLSQVQLAPPPNAYNAAEREAALETPPEDVLAGAPISSPPEQPPTPPKK